MWAISFVLACVICIASGRRPLIPESKHGLESNAATPPPAFDALTLADQGTVDPWKRSPLPYLLMMLWPGTGFLTPQLGKPLPLHRRALPREMRELRLRWPMMTDAGDQKPSVPEVELEDAGKADVVNVPVAAGAVDESVASTKENAEESEQSEQTEQSEKSDKEEAKKPESEKAEDKEAELPDIQEKPEEEEPANILEEIAQGLGEVIASASGEKPEMVSELKKIIEKSEAVEEEVVSPVIEKAEEEILVDLAQRFVAEVKRRFKRSVMRVVRSWNQLTISSSPLFAYARASFACLMVVILQTIRPEMLGQAPAKLTATVTSWASWRAANQALVNIPCAFGMFMSTDVLMQTFDQQRSITAEERTRVGIQVSRMVRAAIVSAFLNGFLSVYYHRWLASLRFFPKNFCRGRKGWQARLCPYSEVFPKILIDLGLYEPIFSSMYISLQALLRGQPKQILAELKAKVFQIWITSPKYWIWIDLLNFSVINVRLRPLFASLANIPWAAYLSFMANLPEFSTPDSDPRRAYAKRIVEALDPDKDGRVNKKQFEEFWKATEVNAELASIAGDRRKFGFWPWLRPVDQLPAKEQAGLVVKLLTELEAGVPSKLVSQIRVALAPPVPTVNGTIAAAAGPKKIIEKLVNVTKSKEKAEAKDQDGETEKSKSKDASKDETLKDESRAPKTTKKEDLTLDELEVLKTSAVKQEDFQKADKYKKEIARRKEREAKEKKKKEKGSEKEE